MKLVTGQLKPSQGQVTVLGAPIWGNPTAYAAMVNGGVWRPATLYKVEPGKVYTLEEAVALLSEVSTVKFKEAVEVSINLGVDPYRELVFDIRNSQTLARYRDQKHGNGGGTFGSAV